MSKTLLIDINSWGHAGQHAKPLMANGIQTQSAFAILNGMVEAKRRFPRHDFMVLWDSRAQWRYDLYPGYKGDRESDPQKVADRASYDTQKPYIVRALAALGIPQIWAKGYEADDLAGHFVKVLTKCPTNEVVLSTGDQDWLQLVRPNVTWYDKRDHTRLVTMRNFQDFTGCKTPYQFLEAKVMQGDSSDSISPVGGIGPQGAPEFVAEFGSVLNFWRMCDSGQYVPTKKAHLSLWRGTSPHTKEEWVTNMYDGDPDNAKMLKKHIDQWPGQGRDLFKRNFRLMNLLAVPPPPKDSVKLIRGKPDKEAFKEVCAELSFMTIINRLDTYFEVFE